MRRNPSIYGANLQTARDQIQTCSNGAKAELETIEIHQFRRWRKARKLTQQQVATACGYVPSFISKLEKGQRRPSADLQEQLSAFQRRMDEESDLVKIWQKHCWHCDRTLDISCFAQDRKRKSTGLQSKCRECSDVLSDRWRERNRERLTLPRKQKSVSKQARRPTKLQGERYGPRDAEELRSLGEEGVLKLRKKPNRGYSNERKNAIEKVAVGILAKYPESPAPTRHN